jgi:predicted dehydrogenase
MADGSVRSLSVGLAGYGRWGRLICRDLLALGADVHVAVPNDASRAAALAAGAVAAYERAGDFPSLDGYVVAVPTVLHAEVIQSLLDRRRPIFVEKPLTNDPAAARKLVEAAGDRIFVMDKWRYHPGVLELARLAKSGELGQIIAIKSYRLGWGNPHSDVDAIWILAPHDLSIVLEILGHVPLARAAFSATPDDPGGDMTALLGEDGGPTVTIQVSSLHPTPRRSVVVVGTRATAELGDSYDDRVMVVEAGGARRDIAIGAEMPLMAELRTFLSHLAGGPPPRSAALDGLLVVERVAELRGMLGIAE